MATGTGLIGIVTALLPLIGLVAVLSARRKRRKGIETPVEAEFDRRQAERAEMERRMASYLATRGSAGRDAADDDSEQEIRR
jgi:hypothetical protein